MRTKTIRSKKSKTAWVEDWEDWGQTESFLAFQQLDKFEGNIPSVPDFSDFSDFPAVLAPTVLRGADTFDARRIAAYRRGAIRGPYRHQPQRSAQ